MIRNRFKQIPSAIRWSILMAVVINVSALTFVFAHHDPHDLIVGDAIVYEELAVNLVEGEGFGVFTDEGFIAETFRTPGLPFLYALFLKAGFGLKAYLFTLSIVSSITLPLCGWYIGRRIFGEGAGTITGVLLAFDPLIYTHNWTLLTEIPFLICLLTGIVLLMHVKEESISPYSCGAGILFAIAAYIRPAALPLLVVAFMIIILYRAMAARRVAYGIIVALLFMGACLLPYVVHMERTTGVYALSGTGWRNVYTDYLASIRALNKGTSFVDEKRALKEYARNTWGFDRSKMDSPSSSETYKLYAIPEIMQNWRTVLKLQSMLFITYFTHTDYQRRLQKLDLLPDNRVEEGRKSSSRLVMDEGLAAIPEIYKEMENRYFIPIVERGYTLLVFLFAAVGFFVSKTPYRFLILLLLALGYLTSSAIGLGVEGRLRLPLLPFYFMLAAVGILFISRIALARFRLWKR